MPDADSASHSCSNMKIDCVPCTGAAHSIFTRIERVAKTRNVFHASCPYTTKAWCFSGDLIYWVVYVRVCDVRPPSSWLLFPLFIFRNATIQNGSTQNRQTKFHNGGGQAACVWCVCVCLGCNVCLGYQTLQVSNIVRWKFVFSENWFSQHFATNSKLGFQMISQLEHENNTWTTIRSPLIYWINSDERMHGLQSPHIPNMWRNKLFHALYDCYIIIQMHAQTIRSPNSWLLWLMQR